MEDEAITFEYIRKVQREEQYDQKLSNIPDDFYKKSKDYLERKRKLLKKKPGKMASIEISNIERLLEDIYNRRESKIIRQAIISARTEIPPENLISDEEKIFKDILKILKTHRGKSLSLLLGKTKEKSDLAQVKFKENVPEFLGHDEKKYGPYKKDETAKLPRKNADLMVKNKLAEKIR